MIILKVKDVETDEDSLEMPEWMNNTHDIESDGSESPSDYNPDLLSDTSSDTSSNCSCNLDDVAKDLDELCNDADQEDLDNSSDNAASSLSDDMDNEIDGLELFPAYHLPDNMGMYKMDSLCTSYLPTISPVPVLRPLEIKGTEDTSDDEETAMARGCWFWYLYGKRYVSFPAHTNRDTDSDDRSGMTESTSGTEEKSKSLDDSKLFDPSTTDKADTAPDETKAEKSTHSILNPLDT